MWTLPFVEFKFVTIKNYDYYRIWRNRLYTFCIGFTFLIKFRNRLYTLCIEDSASNQLLWLVDDGRCQAVPVNFQWTSNGMELPINSTSIVSWTRPYRVDTGPGLLETKCMRPSAQVTPNNQNASVFNDTFNNERNVVAWSEPQWSFYW